MGVFTPLRRTAAAAVMAKRFGLAWGRRLAGLDCYPAERIAKAEHGVRIYGLPRDIQSLTPATRLLLRNYRAIGDLAGRGETRFDWDDASISAETSGVHYRLESTADIMVAHEVFVQRMYGGHTPECDLVLDVGSNIGLGSLFFSQAFDARVYAYELSPSTAMRAQANLLLNPQLAQRITLTPSGWGDRSGEAEIVVHPEMHASHSFVQPATWTGEIERVAIMDAAEELSKLLPEASRGVLLKLDVEGAEYDIIRHLDRNGLLASFKVVFIEWHRVSGRDPEEIRNSLAANGFHWFEDRHPLVDVGMIRAFRSQ